MTATTPKAAPQVANAPPAAAATSKAPEARAGDAQPHAPAAHDGFAVQLAAEKLNRLQFLTIRRYLSLVFATLVLLLLILVSR